MYNPDGFDGAESLYYSSILAPLILVYHQELEVDSVDLSFNGKDLLLTASNPRMSWLYQCPRNYLPYSTYTTPTTQEILLNLISTNTPTISLESNLYSYDRCAFYAGTVDPRTFNAFAMTAYHCRIGHERDTFTELCFWDFGGPADGVEFTGSPLELSECVRLAAHIAHKCRIPGLKSFDVSCSGSESGEWGVFLCGDEESWTGRYDHDFEIDVGVQGDEVDSNNGQRTVDNYLRSASPISDESGSKADIFMVHYDSLTRTSSVHQPILPSSLPGFSEHPKPYSWINKIKAVEFDERLGVLFILLDGSERTSLYGLEFVG